MRNLIKNTLQAILVILVFTGSTFSANSNLPDFTKLVENNKASIVNISTVKKNKNVNKNKNPNPNVPNDELNDFLRKFFGDKGFDGPERKQPRQSQSVGSGFIYSSNGYIITNHHVIADADQIIVRLKDKRELDAQLIGSDPSSDIALLKIIKPV